MCVRARDRDIIQPKAPLRKGEGLLCPSVPRAKDRARGQMSADDPCHAASTCTHSFLLSFFRSFVRSDHLRSTYILTHFLVGVCVRERVRVPLSTLHARVYMPLCDPARRWSLHAHGYCVSFVGIFGDAASLVPTWNMRFSGGKNTHRTLAPLYHDSLSLSFSCSFALCFCACSLFLHDA